MPSALGAMQRIVTHAHSPHDLTAKTSVILVITYFTKKTKTHYLDDSDPSLLIEATHASYHHASKQKQQQQQQQQPQNHHLYIARAAKGTPGHLCPSSLPRAGAI